MWLRSEAWSPFLWKVSLSFGIFSLLFSIVVLMKLIKSRLSQVSNGEGCDALSLFLTVFLCVPQLLFG